MARNGSGTMTPSVDFTTEAASPPIEIAKLDTVLDDIAAEITNSIAADGQTNPSADLKMNGFKHTNVGAATALTHYARVTELIDQDHIYYVDSGSANTYVITPSPAISAYEEGQRFVFRAANANSGASTLNVNALGAIAIQTVNAAALASGAIVAGGIYEVTYDANASPDRWVLTSSPSAIDGLLSSNVPLKNAANTFTASQTINGQSALVVDAASVSFAVQSIDATKTQFGTLTAHPLHFLTNSVDRFVISNGGNFDFKGGTVTTNNGGASEVGFKGIPTATDETPVLADAGKVILATGNVTVPANSSVAYPTGTVLSVYNATGGSITIAVTTDTLTLAGSGTSGTRTLASTGLVTILKVSSTAWVISGAGLS